MRRLRGDLIAAFRYLKGGYKNAGEGLLAKACSDRTKYNGFKLKEGRFRLKEMRALRHGNRLSREAVVSPPWKCSRPGCMGL